MCTFAAISLEFTPVRDQILASPTVPTMDEVYSRLLRVSSVPTVPLFSVGDHSVMASQVQSSGEQGGDRGNQGKRLKCNYCHK